MTTPLQIADAHCQTYDPKTKDSSCRCGAKVRGRAWLVHVVEVAQAAAREQVAR